MCTLTFVPTREGIIFTSNRDEGTDRKPSKPPQKMDTGPVATLAPIDTNSGGTWFAATEQGTLHCLLNGAFKSHKRKPPYRLSRGHVIPGYIKAGNRLPVFMETFRLNNIEPFTLVTYDPSLPLTKQIIEFRWDGKQKYVQFFQADQPLVWASATLYDDQAYQDRINWLHNWLENKPLTHESLMQFHREGGNGNPENDMRVKRGNWLKTVSITSTMLHPEEVHMCFDALNGALPLSLKIPRKL